MAGPSRHLFRWNDNVSVMSFDAVVEENFTRTADLSRYPIELGSTITDHYQINPVGITLELFVSDTPVRAQDNFMNKGVTSRKGESPLFRQILDDRPAPRIPRFALPSGRLIRNTTANIRLGESRSKLSAQTLIFEGGSPNRVVNVFDQLNSFMEEATLITVASRLRSWPNMAIVMLEAPTDAQSGSGILFSLEMQQVNLVQTQAVFGGAVVRRNKGDKKKLDGGGETESVGPEKESDIITQLVEGGTEEARKVLKAAKEGLTEPPTPAAN